MIEVISNPLGTVQMATGRIRTYQIIVGGLTLLNLPISYLFLRLGYAPSVVYVVAISLSICVLVARLLLLKNMIALDVIDFLKKVVLDIMIVTIVSVPIPFVLSIYLNNSFSSFCWITLLSLLFSMASVYYIGLSTGERSFVLSSIKRVIKRK